MMVRYPIIGSLLLVLLLAAFKTKRYQVDGYLDDVSPNGQYVLYEAPAVWELGEYRFGNLRVLDVETGNITIIPDQVLIEECKSFFLKDSIVAIQPSQGRVELYNFQTEKLEKVPLLTYNKKFTPLQFALNKDRSKAALILLDMDKKLKDNDSRHEPTYRVELKVVDLKNGKEYVDEHYDYIGGTDIHKGDIIWYENGIFYAYQNSCYYYDLAKKKSSRINDEKKFHMDNSRELTISDKSIIYQDKGLSIQLLLTTIPYGYYTLTRNELLISKDSE
jgi:hypothetical protein